MVAICLALARSADIVPSCWEVWGVTEHHLPQGTGGSSFSFLGGGHCPRAYSEEEDDSRKETAGLGEAAAVKDLSWVPGALWRPAVPPRSSQHREDRQRGSAARAVSCPQSGAGLADGSAGGARASG